MDYSLLLILYSLFFVFITWNRFHWGLCIFFFLLPTYLIRFNIGPLPTTLLEVMLEIIVIIWIIKFNKQIFSKLKEKFKENYNYTLIFAILIFLLAATISVFTSINIRSALGEWKTFFIEPILFFLILITTLKNKKHLQNIIFTLILSGLITSILAIYQHFTGWMVPWFFWENANSFRVTAWYGFPNGVGLFLSPLLLLSLFLIDKKEKITWILPIVFIPLGILAIAFAKSTGGLIGVLGGFILLTLLYKKTRWWIIGLGIITIVSLFTLPQLSNIKDEITFQDRSGQIRISMWGEATEFLSNNKILGAGFVSYQEKVKPYHTTVDNEGVEIFHHPHNIFLTMWVNLGILGLFGFIWILTWYFRVGLTNLNPQTKILLATMTVIIITGLVDSPYIKNDLSILFWLLPALLITQKYENLENT